MVYCCYTLHILHWNHVTIQPCLTWWSIGYFVAQFNEIIRSGNTIKSVVSNRKQEQKRTFSILLILFQMYSCFKRQGCCIFFNDEWSVVKNLVKTSCVWHCKFIWQAEEAKRKIELEIKNKQPKSNQKSCCDWETAKFKDWKTEKLNVKLKIKYLQNWLHVGIDTLNIMLNTWTGFAKLLNSNNFSII